jgi:hypothetical protein
VAGLAGATITLLAGLVLLLALLPSYAGLAAGFDLQPARLLAPLATYLFRNAVTNTCLLVVGVYLLALLLGWTWAVTGVTPRVRPLLLMPLFLPGVLVGLLWRPLFVPWLALAQMEVPLAITALVLLWRAVPLAAWWFSRDRHAWPTFISHCALVVLLDADLVLTLTRGEPFNASHTWGSWLLGQLWVSRAWGYAASMAGTLGLVMGLLALWGTWRGEKSVDGLAPVPHGSPLGDATLVAWLLGPFALPLLALLQEPRFALATLVEVGGAWWLVNGALLWAGATWLATHFATSLGPTLSSLTLRRTARALAVGMLPVATVGVAYLAHTLPLLASRWPLMVLLGLFTAALLIADPAAESHIRWSKVAGYAALVMAHTFPLQLVLDLPPAAWTPTLGTVWMLAEAPQSGALGVALLLIGLWAGVGAWLCAR